MRHLIAATLVIAASLPIRAEQAPPAPLALGAAAGSWVAAVTTAGGFTRRGAGSMSISSDGNAACDAPLQCAATVPADGLRRVAGSIQVVAGAAWERPSRSVCNDCIVTTLTVRTRQPDGTESRMAFTWDNVEAAHLPATVRAVYDAVMAVGGR